MLRKSVVEMHGRQNIERLVNDKAWLGKYRVTAKEAEAISSIALLGEVASERDLLFVLNQIRRARLRR